MTTPRSNILLAGGCLIAGFGTLSLEANAQVSGFWPAPPSRTNYPVGEGRNVRSLGHNALQGRSAYHPVIQRQIIEGEEYWIAYVGHHAGEAMNALTGRVEANGTSILEVSNPREPVYIHHIAPVEGTSGAQMARVCSGDELPRGAPGSYYLLRAGATYHELWDVTNPVQPRLLSTVSQGLVDTHKSWWECSTGIAYLVSGVPGWRAERMTQIFDLSAPANPRFIKNFGLPGQQPGATGEVPEDLHGCISVIERNRVYCGHGTGARGVLAILDRQKLLEDAWADPASPTAAELRSVIVGEIGLPDFMGAHTSLPVLGMTLPEFAVDGFGHVRDFVVIVNEQTRNECTEQARQMMYLVDITDERHPWPVSTFNVPEETGDFCSVGGRFGAHGSHENPTPIFYGKLVFVTWFNAGVRVVDIRDPYHPTEVGYYIPAANTNTDRRCIEVGGQERCKVAVQTNNVEVDDRGYIYIVDRANSGLEILDLERGARRIAAYP